LHQVNKIKYPFLGGIQTAIQPKQIPVSSLVQPLTRRQ
jgi:hypothetical protein